MFAVFSVWLRLLIVILLLRFYQYIKESIDRIVAFFKSSASISQTLALETAAAVQVHLPYLFSYPYCHNMYAYQGFNWCIGLVGTDMYIHTSCIRVYTCTGIGIRLDWDVLLASGGTY